MLEDRTDYFLLAYDSPTFSAAAAKVPMSPQGFSKIIRNLERDLGVPLFETDERGVRKPTAYADELYRFAKRMQAERGQLEAAFGRIANEGHVELKVACALGIPGLFGAESIVGFSETRPGVTVSFSEFPDTLCDSLVADGVFDVGLSLQPVNDTLNSRELFESRHYIWINRNDPMSNRTSLTLEDLQGRNLAMPGREFRCFQNLHAAFNSAGYQTPRIIEYSEIFWIYYFVLSGKGLGWSLPHLANLDFFNNPDEIAAIPLEGLNWCVCFTWPKSRDLSSCERDYLDYIVRQSKKLDRMHNRIVTSRFFSST